MSYPSPVKERPVSRRAKPGATGEGNFYHIEIRPKTVFRSFRTQDVDRNGGTKRVAGKRDGGSWDTQKWLISTELAYVELGRLTSDNEHVCKVLEELGSKPVRWGGDRFKAAPRRNVPESEKPMLAQRRARQAAKKQSN